MKQNHENKEESGQNADAGMKGDIDGGKLVNEDIKISERFTKCTYYEDGQIEE